MPNFIEQREEIRRRGFNLSGRTARSAIQGCVRILLQQTRLYRFHHRLDHWNFDPAGDDARLRTLKDTEGWPERLPPREQFQWVADEVCSLWGRPEAGNNRHQMDAFGYLSVLLSIIIGLAVTQLLTGMRGTMLARERVKGFWPTQVWAGSLLLVCTQTWWAMFDLRDWKNWNFASFGILLAQTIALYLLTGLVYPDFPPERVVDLRAHYFAQRRHFFSLALISTALSLGRDLILHHRLPDSANLGFHLFWAASAASGLMIAREGYHKFLALLAPAMFVSYVALLFARLR